MGYVLECHELDRWFGSNHALKKVNLQLESGRIIGLLGPNGSGKTTLIKLANGLIKPNSGELLVLGQEPGVETKRQISYLPDQMFYADWMRVKDMLRFFEDFYQDFEPERARKMLEELKVNERSRIKSLSKGTKEKVQLVMAMSRRAKLYLLDEPIGGVDPAAREFILKTILSNYNREASIIISTHLISDVEKVLDEVVFIQEGSILRHDTVDNIREQEGRSLDQLFRDLYRQQVVGD